MKARGCASVFPRMKEAAPASPFFSVKGRETSSKKCHILMCIRHRLLFDLLFSTDRASDILRKKKQNFAGFSGANSRKNRLISRDFRGKSQNSRNNRPISGDFRGGKVKIPRKNGPFRGILAEKSQFSKDFQGQILRKIGRFHVKFRGETSPRNNQ